MISTILAFLTVINCLQQIEAIDVVPRSEWGAISPKKPLVNIKGAAAYVVVHHSASRSCNSKNDCSQMIRGFQKNHQNVRGWRDIGYNFLIDSSGNVYEGQGWGRFAAHAGSLNSKSVGICMIGTFTDELPPQAALNSLNQLILSGVSANKIKSDYKLVGHRIVKSTECPGTKLFNYLKTLQNFSNSL